MLLEFRVKNFRSFKDLAVFSMIGANAFKEHEPRNIKRIDAQTKALKTAAIYGNNASGKSNLVKAMVFMRRFVLNSFRDALTEENDQGIGLDRFLLHTENLSMPAFFEISFLIEETLYRYGFEIDELRVQREWLYQTIERETKMFERIADAPLEFNKNSFSEADGVKLKPNVLLLTRLAHDADTGSTTSKIAGWFAKQFNIINGAADTGYRLYTVKRLREDQAFAIWVEKFAQLLEISKLSVEVTEMEELPPVTFSGLGGVSEVAEGSYAYRKIKIKLQAWHRQYDSNNFLVGTVPFDFDRQESEGTKKLVYLLGPWYDTLQNGKTLVVDELDQALHPNLLKVLLDFFHEHNDKGAQLIFVTHNTVLLKNDTMRRDQVWFVEKNQFGASSLYALGDFKSEQVRKSTAFDKNYLEGKYGAVPYFGEILAPEELQNG